MTERFMLAPPLLAGHDLVDDFQCPLGSDLTVHLVVDQHHRSQAAGAEARDGLDGEQMIGGRLALLVHTQPLVQRVQRSTRERRT